MFLGAPAIALALSNDCMVVSFLGVKNAPIGGFRGRVGIARWRQVVEQLDLGGYVQSAELHQLRVDAL